jgi:hypothetical protein
LPEIFIKKPDPDGFSDGLTHGFNLAVFLKFAVQKRRAKRIKLSMLGDESSGSQPVVVAKITAILFPEGNISDKTLHVVSFLIYDVKTG